MSAKKTGKPAAEAVAAAPALKPGIRNAVSKERLMNLLLAPHVSEKSARAAEAANQFVFRVRGDATRTTVKQAVELMFAVKVESVQVLNLPGKRRRFGQIQGRRSGFKKAYVRLAAGQSIDFAGAPK